MNPVYQDWFRPYYENMLLPKLSLNPKYRRQEDLRAFTLVEPLVVIAIIALLASLLLPSLQSVRKTALATTCRANLRSVGQAIVLFASDHEGRIPWCEYVSGKNPKHAYVSWDDQDVRLDILEVFSDNSTSEEPSLPGFQADLLMEPLDTSVGSRVFISLVGPPVGSLPKDTTGVLYAPDPMALESWVFPDGRWTVVTRHPLDPAMPLTDKTATNYFQIITFSSPAGRL